MYIREEQNENHEQTDNAEKVVHFLQFRIYILTRR